MSGNSGRVPTTCALAGCAVPLVQRTGGGRPRLYCSDAHRAEARRRRLVSDGSRPTVRTPGAGGEAGLEGVRDLLQEALSGLGRLQAGSRDDALVATIRAEATAEILRAQQEAADAARQAAAAEDLLARERGEWHATLEGLVAERAEHLRAVEELSGALDGARSELGEELLRHHADAEHAESVAHALRAAHAAELEQMAAGVDELRQLLAGALAGAEQAEQRRERAERLLAEHSRAAVELEVRVARAEEQSLQAAARLEERREELVRLRNELAGERRRRAVEPEPRRRASRPAPARAPRPPRRPPQVT